MLSISADDQDHMHAPDFPELLNDSAAQRRTMVDCQVRTFNVTDQRLIDRFLEVPRELFVPDAVRGLAYSDIGFVMPSVTPDQEARYLLPPFVLARLIQGGRLRRTDRVLDVASGAGYSTAVLAGLAREVTALESDGARCAELATRLAAFGLAGVRTHAGHLSDGTSPDDRYDLILVNGAVETNLETLFGQLAEGGRLLAIRRGAKDPAGRATKATCFEKHGQSISGRYLFDASAPSLRAFRDTPQFVF